MQPKEIYLDEEELDFDLAFDRERERERFDEEAVLGLRIRSLLDEVERVSDTIDDVLMRQKYYREYIKRRHLEDIQRQLKSILKEYP